MSSCWMIIQEPIGGLPSVALTIPPSYSINIKLVSTSSILPNQMPLSTERDCLWIICKPATEDNPYGWKEALRKAAERLNLVHPDRPVYLLIAIGWKCMFFVWDPMSEIVLSQPSLAIQPVSGPPP